MGLPYGEQNTRMEAGTEQRRDTDRGGEGGEIQIQGWMIWMRIERLDIGRDDVGWVALDRDTVDLGICICVICLLTACG